MTKSTHPVILLPWQASTALLCLACVPVAWVCRTTGARGWPNDPRGSAFLPLLAKSACEFCCSSIILTSLLSLKTMMSN